MQASRAQSQGEKHHPGNPIGSQHTAALYGNQCCPEVKHDISHHIKHRAYVYAWVHVHSPVDDHQIDQQHYHMDSELEMWQKREGRQAIMEENIQTPVRTWIGPKNHKEWPKAMNWYRGQQQLNEFWFGLKW